MKNYIVITSWELDENPEESFLLGCEDKDLTNAISDFYENHLKILNEDLFERKHNIIVTNKAYYGAFYEDELTLVNQ